MAGESPEKAILASMDGTTETLSPCLRLLIEILLGEPITPNSDIAAVRDIDSGHAEEQVPSPEQSLEPSSSESRMALKQTSSATWAMSTMVDFSSTFICTVIRCNP